MRDDEMRTYGAVPAPRSGNLLRQAYLLTGDPRQAERLTERALAATTLHTRRFGPSGADEYARAELVRSFVADPAFGAQHAQGAPGTSGGRTAVWQALSTLPARRRAVIVLRYDEGLSEEQIADRMGSNARSVLADAEAGLLTLRTAVAPGTDPRRLVTDALAEAGARWTAWLDPADAPGQAEPAQNGQRSGRRAEQARPVEPATPGEAERFRRAGGPQPAQPRTSPSRQGGAEPHQDGPGGPPKPAPAGPGGAGRSRGGNGANGHTHAIAAFPLASDRRRWRTPAIVAAAALTTLVLGAVAIVVPALVGDSDAPDPAAASASATGQSATTREVPSRSVPKGLLDWPARGPQGNDQSVLSAATQAWRAKAKGSEAPVGDVSMLYAGSVEGRQVALLQSLDRAGKPRIAQLAGDQPSSLALVKAEPLAAGTAVIPFLPASGPSGPLRVLVSPEAQAANGLLASDVMKTPLKKMSLDKDGVSQVLPSPPGTPTCSRVVVMGLPGPLGRTGPRVLQSGIAVAEMMGLMTEEVEVGSSTLAAGETAIPEKQWLDDGKLLQKRLKGKIVIAALGPRIGPQPLSSADRRVLHSRAYEVRRGAQRYTGLVVSLNGKTICSTVSPVRAAPGSQPVLAGYALRCPLMYGTAGLVHVVGGPDVESVQVSLSPTPNPPGQRPYGNSLQRPSDANSASGFAVLDLVPVGFPCGPGTVQASGGASSSPPTMLPVFTP